MGPYWVILLKYGSHEMRHTGFRRLTVVNGTPGLGCHSPCVGHVDMRTRTGHALDTCPIRHVAYCRPYSRSKTLDTTCTQLGPGLTRLIDFIDHFLLWA